MRIAILSGVLVGLTACGGANQCERYVDAALSCIESAGGETTGYDYDTQCAGYTKQNKDYYSCLADAYEGADCSTIEGLTSAGTASASCTPA